MSNTLLRICRLQLAVLFFVFILIHFQNGTGLWKILLEERENVILCHVGLCLESKQLVPSAVTRGW